MSDRRTDQAHSHSSPAPEATSGGSDPSTFPGSLARKSILIFSGAILGYLILSIRCIDGKYVDFGDGNYLYFLYRDMPCPQPPLLLFLGRFLLSLADGNVGLVRLWQVLQHVLTACCVWGITHRLFKQHAVSTLAGCTFLFLPEGVWWSAGYQSEPLLVFLQSFNLLLLLNAMAREKPSPALYGAAFIAAMTAFTNMTSLPYIALQTFFVWFLFRRGFRHYLGALLIPGILFFIYMLFYSEGQYLEHVFFRQIGTYPTHYLQEALQYFLIKLNTEGGDILFYEGGFVLAAIAGILLFSNDERPVLAKEYMIWWAIFSLGSILFVTKGGTVEYIFTIGEPAVAVFSAYFFTNLLLAIDIPTSIKILVTSPLQLGKVVLLLTIALPALLMKPIDLLSRTLSNNTLTYEQSGQMYRKVFELSSAEMNRIAQFIQFRCPPGKTMLCPPYYAFSAHRKITDNASELFILYLAYFNEWERFKSSNHPTFRLPGLDEMQSAIRTGNRETPYSAQEIYSLAEYFKNHTECQTQYPAIHLFLQLRQRIIDGEVALILSNENHLFFWVPPLHQAIRDYCTPISQPLQLPTREERIVAYVPK